MGNKRRFKRFIKCFLLQGTLFKKILPPLLLILFVGNVLALPQGSNVIHGDINLSQDYGNGIDLLINQLSNQGIIDWESFNIGINERVHFNQPSSSAITLNRVLSNVRSDIFGRLSATGQIMLLNRAGILFGPNAVVDVSALIATTADISNQNFLAGNYSFNQPAASLGNIENQGLIKVANHGLVALVAPGVENSGVIQANLGKVLLAGLPAGSNYTLDLYGDKLINFMVNEDMAEQFAKSSDGVKQSGEMHADAGKVLITAHAAHKVLDDVINMSGLIHADTVSEQNGEIILSGGPSGVVNVSGKISARGNKTGEKGGKVVVTGDKVGLFNGAKIDVSGQAGGGTVLIGGEYLGADPVPGMDLPIANSTYMDFEAAVFANALASADGGRIIVWGTDSAQVHGMLEAKGGPQGGDGGFVETSGHYLDSSKARVNVSAAQGETGTWLLDPFNVVITSFLTTQNGAFGGGDPNIWLPSASSSRISVTDVVNNLNNANVIIRTGGTGSPGGESGDITVISLQSDWTGWTSNNDLILEAYGSIFFGGSDETTFGIEKTSGSGNLILRADTEGRYDQSTSLFGTVSFAFDELIETFLTRIDFSAVSGDVIIYHNVLNYDPFTPPNYPILIGTGNFVEYLLVNDVGGPLSGGRTTGLQYIAKNANTLDNDYALGRDFDASATSSWNAGAGFQPIGTSATPFEGNFEGNDHTISDLTINRPTTDEVGLFGAFYGFFNLPSIENFNLSNVDITGQNNTGAVVGTLDGGTFGAILNNIRVLSGTVIGTNQTGGIVGAIIGDGILSNLQNAASVSGTNYVGGIVGRGEDFTLARAINTGSVVGSADLVGGIVGVLQDAVVGDSLVDSFNAGSVTGDDYVGGIVGGLVDTNARIERTHNIGSVTGNSFVGGLLGAMFNPVGFVVDANIGAQINNSYWNTETSGQTTSYRQTTGPSTIGGLTTSQMVDQSSFGGWDFAIVWDISGSVAEGFLYPFLRWLPEVFFLGIEPDPAFIEEGPQGPWNEGVIPTDTEEPPPDMVPPDEEVTPTDGVEPTEEVVPTEEVTPEEPAPEEVAPEPVPEEAVPEEVVPEEVVPTGDGVEDGVVPTGEAIPTGEPTGDGVPVTDLAAVRSDTVIPGYTAEVDNSGKLPGAANNNPMASARGVVRDLSAILKKGRIVVALPIVADNTFVNRDQQGEVHGYSVDMAIDIARALGIKVAFNKTGKKPKDIVKLLAENRVDMSINSIPTSTSDAQKILFTKPNIVLQQTLLVDRVWIEKARERLVDISDPILEMKKLPITIGILQDSDSDIYAKALFPFAHINKFVTTHELTSALNSEKIKAIYADNLVIDQLLAKHPSLNLRNQELLLDDRGAYLSLAAAPGEWKMWQWLNQYLEIKSKLNLTAQDLVNYEGKY